MSLLKLRVFSPKKTFSTCNCASPLPPFPPYNFIRPLLKYRHYTTQCLEFPSFISLQLTIHFFLPPFLPSLFIPRLSSQGYFSLCSSSFLPSLSLSFSKRKIHIFHGRRCNTSPGRPRPMNFSLVPISFASECSFLNRFRQPFTIYTRGGDTKRLSYTPRCREVYSFDSIESSTRRGGDVCSVVNVKEIWKLLVDNVTVLRQYVLSYRYSNVYVKGK